MRVIPELGTKTARILNLKTLLSLSLTLLVRPKRGPVLIAVAVLAPGAGASL